MQEVSAKSSENGSGIPGVEAKGTTPADIQVSQQNNKSLSDARPERGGSSDPTFEVVDGGRQPPTTTLKVFGGDSDFPPLTGSKTAEQSLSSGKDINPLICSHPESRRQEIQQAYARGVCPECGAPLRFGSSDPCEGDYYWCSGCGDGPVLFPLYHRMPIAPIIDAEQANAALSLVQQLKPEARV